MKNNILYATGELDVLSYYSKVAPVLKTFLKNKRIAAKVRLKDMFFLKRGSNSNPLYIEDFSVVNNKMLELRKNHLKEIRDKLNNKQQLVWDYFPPRKLIDFFYATNSEKRVFSDSPNLKRFRDEEGAGKKIERIFIDIDRRQHTSEEARKIANSLVDVIKKDKEFNRLVKYEIVVLWTGSSFHVYLLLKKSIDIRFYNKYLSYGGKEKEYSFIMKWAKEVETITKIPCKAGHEKSDKFIILDSSNTPSGKLARVPFSLHMANWNTVDGVCVPISEKELGSGELVKKLQKLTPDDILKSLNKYKGLL